MFFNDFSDFILSTPTNKFIEIIFEVRSTDTVYRKTIKPNFFYKVRSTVTVYNTLIINKVSVLRTLKSVYSSFSINGVNPTDFF